jgi:hypothetical protein
MEHNAQIQKTETEVKRIQSRVLTQELTQQEIDEVSGAGCSPTGKVTKKVVKIDVSCTF